MFQRKTSRFRRRPNSGRGHRQHNGGLSQPRQNSFSNGHSRNNFRQTLSAEKLYEKYTTLANEAISSGDKTLSENYFQHADHFLRIIEDKNRNQDQNKVNNNEVKTVLNNNYNSEKTEIKQDSAVKIKE